MKPDLEKIVEQYGTMISSISHRMIQNKEVAKEAAQEVWYEIIRSIGSFNGQSELSTWIYTTSVRMKTNSKDKKIFETQFSAPNKYSNQIAGTICFLPASAPHLSPF